MKQNKFYVPVKTGYMNNKPLFTLLCVDKMKSLQGKLPNDTIISKHILNQYDKGSNYQPIQIRMNVEEFEVIKKEIRTKINNRLILDIQSIDIILDSATLPVVQIIK